ncbi:hypothetical protein MUK42_14682 [Musa troglodytarum]|uniref:Uncharacterized protein n=1 Tax=Musa troglodytarum TaxID=320322 RepID=A0A9E7L8Q7_9LILI|nr:hypothetical protein MUK42_14682 [Musa troglodytarum]
MGCVSACVSLSGAVNERLQCAMALWIPSCCSRSESSRRWGGGEGTAATAADAGRFLPGRFPTILSPAGSPLSSATPAAGTGAASCGSSAPGPVFGGAGSPGRTLAAVSPGGFATPSVVEFRGLLSRANSEMMGTSSTLNLTKSLL